MRLAFHAGRVETISYPGSDVTGVTAPSLRVTSFPFLSQASAQGSKHDERMISHHLEHGCQLNACASTELRPAKAKESNRSGRPHLKMYNQDPRSSCSHPIASTYSTRIFHHSTLDNRYRQANVRTMRGCEDVANCVWLRLKPI